MPKLFNIFEVASEMRMSVRWIRTKIKDEKIKVVKFGGKTFITEGELNRILREGVE